MGVRIPPIGFQTLGTLGWLERGDLALTGFCTDVLIAGNHVPQSAEKKSEKPVMTRVRATFCIVAPVVLCTSVLTTAPAWAQLPPRSSTAA